MIVIIYIYVIYNLYRLNILYKTNINDKYKYIQINIFIFTLKIFTVNIIIPYAIF